MKYLNKIIVFCLSGILLSACDFIAPEEFTIRSADQINSNWNYIPNLRLAPYYYLPLGYNNIGKGWLSNACDESEHGWDNENIQSFNIGNWNQFSNPDEVWARNYQGIRKANDFLYLTDTLTWSDFKLSNPTEYDKRIKYTKQYRDEMSFLKAFFYFELIKRYGGVPLVTEKLQYNGNTDELKSYKRASFESCVNYITAQCDTAAKYLPITQAASDNGSPTKGAALALKARMLLYAASDIFNKTDNTDSIIGYLSGGDRQQRWKKAALAANAVFGITPKYALHTDYRTLFTLGTTQNTEVIFQRLMGNSNTFETNNYTIGFNSGQTGTCPTQNLIDAYEMTAAGGGGSFDWSNPVHAAKPYLNRDPRLASTVVLNNTTYNGRTIEIWQGGLDGLPLQHASKTGYYLKKYLSENLNLSTAQVSFKQWVYFRLAEVYLNYAEALNEAYGPDYKDASFTLSAREAINRVRARIGVGMPAIPTGLSQSIFRERVRNERRVELAFEDHRYWDVRRWLLGATAIGGEIRGVNIIKNVGNTFTYTPVTIENRVYSQKMELYPIPNAEVVKSNGNVKQNPNW